MLTLEASGGVGYSRTGVLAHRYSHRRRLFKQLSLVQTT